MSRPVLPTNLAHVCGTRRPTQLVQPTHLICIGDLKSVLNESMPIRMLSGERMIKEANDSVHLGKGKAPSKQAVGYPRNNGEKRMDINAPFFGCGGAAAKELL